jgi:hypothetical protein
MRVTFSDAPQSLRCLSGDLSFDYLDRREVFDFFSRVKNALELNAIEYGMVAKSPFGNGGGHPAGEPPLDDRSLAAPLGRRRKGGRRKSRA